MASYVINDSGTSGYSRADFVSALEGKQDVLVSGQNIKTIDGNSVLGAGNLDINVTPPTPQVYPHELTATEQSLKSAAQTALDSDNPVDSNTGKRKYLSFVFFSDLHTVPLKSEVQEDDEASSTVKSSWPNSPSYAGMSCEPTLRVAGSLSFDEHLPVLCGGDFSSGVLPYDCYDYSLEKVKALCHEYILTPLFAVEGNHDRQYSANVARRDNATWLAFLKSFNKARGVNVTYCADNGTMVDNGTRPSNCYYLDFDEYGVRVFMRSQYEIPSTDYANGSGTKTSASYNSNKVFLSVCHTSSEYISHVDIAAEYIRNGGGVGRAWAGAIRGHAHQSLHGFAPATVNVDGSLLKTYTTFPIITVAESFSGRSSNHQTSDYCFSLFTINTDEHRIIERKIGRLTHNDPNAPNEGSESVYSFGYPYLAELTSEMSIECVSIGNNKYQLSLNCGDGVVPPYCEWSLGSTTYAYVNKVSGVLTVRSNATTQQTIAVTAKSSTSKTANITVVYG